MDEEKRTVVQSHLTFVDELAALVTEVFLGYIQEVIGRKIPCVVGLTISGLGLIASPLPKHVGGLYVGRVMAGTGVLALMYSPYTVDYIERES